MHVHIGILLALINFANILILGFFWRFISMKYHSTPVGQAMAFVY